MFITLYLAADLVPFTYYHIPQCCTPEFRLLSRFPSHWRVPPGVVIDVHVSRASSLYYVPEYDCFIRYGCGSWMLVAIGPREVKVKLLRLPVTCKSDQSISIDFLGVYKNTISLWSTSILWWSSLWAVWLACSHSVLRLSPLLLAHLCTEWYCYDNVNFIRIPHNRHPIAHPHGQAVGCLWGIQSLVHALSPSPYCCIQYCCVKN